MEPTTAISAETIAAEKARTRFDEEAMASKLELLSASEVLEWAFDQFGQDMYIACSFQKTSSVVMQLATAINPQARFFYLDTDLLFPETYETRDRLAEHFNVEFERWRGIPLEKQAAEFGDRLWKSDPDACCGLRKVSRCAGRFRRSMPGSRGFAAPTRPPAPRRGNWLGTTSSTFGSSTRSPIGPNAMSGTT